MRAARDQRSATVSKYKDEMKNFDDDELRKEMDNNSIGNRARRTAATLMLLERGGLSEHEAKIKRDDISKSYGRNQGVMEQLDFSLGLVIIKIYLKILLKCNKPLSHHQIMKVMNKEDLESINITKLRIRLLEVLLMEPLN